MPSCSIVAISDIIAFLWFGIAGAAFVFVILKLQHLLPFYRLLGKDVLSTPMTDDLAANTAISFATTTTWQAYGGETTMTYFSQIAALASQNFLAGAAGLAVGIAFIRGIAADGSGVLGNFWRDVIRAVLWVLLPLSIPGALFLVWQGVPMNLHAYTAATTLQGAPLYSSAWDYSPRLRALCTRCSSSASLRGSFLNRRTAASCGATARS